MTVLREYALSSFLLRSYAHTYVHTRAHSLPLARTLSSTPLSPPLSLSLLAISSHDCFFNSFSFFFFFFLFVCLFILRRPYLKKPPTLLSLVLSLSLSRILFLDLSQFDFPRFFFFSFYYYYILRTVPVLCVDVYFIFSHTVRQFQFDNACNHAYKIYQIANENKCIEIFNTKTITDILEN